MSLAGIVTFPKAGATPRDGAAVPVDRLLTETDSPFLAPVPHRGKRNEPAQSSRVVEAAGRAADAPAMPARRANFERCSRTDARTTARCFDTPFKP